MKYEHAGNVIPEQLLKEIQKYAAGKLLYIPSGEEKRAWGEASGYREQLRRRNRMIRNKYTHGLTISELADEYFLSLDSIKKIIYSKNNENMVTYSPTIESAVNYANAGLIEEWVQCYLLLTRKAALNVDELMKGKALHIGVVKFPLRLIQCGGYDLEENIAGETDGDLSDCPPLLVHYEEGKFYSVLQQALLSKLKQSKVNVYPTVILLKENAEYKRFMKHFGNVFIYVDKA